MTKQEAAKWIRATFPIFRKRPNQWLGRVPQGAFGRTARGRPMYCVLGGASALWLASRGKPFHSSEVCVNDLYDALPDYMDIAAANDHARSVPDMVRRVEAVLRGWGL